VGEINIQLTQYKWNHCWFRVAHTYLSFKIYLKNQCEAAKY